MSLTSKFKKADFADTPKFLVPEDTHVGLLHSIIHLGLQKNEFQGVVSIVDQVLLTFELPDVLLDDGRPATVNSRVKVSTHTKSTLTKVVEALGGDTKEGVEFDQLIGKSVMLGILHNTKKTGVYIKTYMQTPATLKKHLKPLLNKKILHLDVDKITDHQKTELPKWVVKVIDERHGHSSSTVKEEDGYIDL